MGPLSSLALVALLGIGSVQLARLVAHIEGTR